MVNFLKPWLLLPPKLAHDLAPYLLKPAGALLKKKDIQWSSFDWRGLHFSNPLGTSGGVDKNAEMIAFWQTQGAGFVEVGTITPEPQKPNPGKIIDRNLRSRALWNKMGFPSKGADYALKQLKKIQKKSSTPVFANIGKNRDTLLRHASKDYMYCIKKLNGYVDAFVINISSPNTTGLRRLLDPDNLKDFLLPIIEVNKETLNPNTQKPNPLLLKISPDMDADQLKDIIEISLKLDIDGWILTNTFAAAKNHYGFPSEGGISGIPLAQKSKDLLVHALYYLGANKKDKLVISCGGIMSSQEARERLELGADLVQVYSALVFEGPNFFAKVDKGNRTQGSSWENPSPLGYQ